MGLWSTVIAASAWITGSQFQPRDGENVLLYEAGRVKRGGPSKHIGRLILTDRRLVHVPIRSGIVRRLRSFDREFLEIPLTQINDVEVGPATGLTRLQQLVKLHTISGDVWLELAGHRVQRFTSRLESARRSVEARETERVD